MKVLVVGAGTMGHSIAEVCALAGYDVLLTDISEEALKNAVAKISWSVKKLEQKEKVKSSDEVQERIKTSTDLAGSARQADFVIEAVVERTDVKREVFPHQAGGDNKRGTDER